MAVIANAQLTMADLTDVACIRQYYLLQGSTLSAPGKPTSNPPGGSWVTAEPSYTSGSTNSLYTVMLTAYTNGEYDYSDVSLSSSYEAAKEAYNKAISALDAVDITNVNVLSNKANIDQQTNEIYKIKSDYTAHSEFGSLKETLTNSIALNKLYSEQVNSYSLEIGTALNQYISYSDGFIRSGIIGVNSKNEPIEGIMIAQHIATEEKTVLKDGTETEVTILKGPSFYSTLTSTELAFWVGDSESDTQNNKNTPVASISNQTLNIDQAVVDGSLTIGEWLISKDNGFTIKWIGG